VGAAIGLIYKPS
jgi:hypothetical protein